MAGNIIELHTEVPAELEANVFGQFDEHLKLIERTLNVTVISRDGILKILGNEQNAASAKKLIEELTVLAKRGNTITKQNVNYALSLAMEQRNEVLTEIDKDFICNTIQGRPIKPKTLGQKDYVEQIRKKMIVFGVGPAGTGKTYLAMAMAVTLFFIVFFPLSTSYLAVHGFLTAIVSGMFTNPLLLSVRKNSPDSSFSRMCQLL